MSDLAPNYALDIELIARRRAAKGMTQTALARALRVSIWTVKRLECGQNHGDLLLRDVGRLATALAVEPRGLFASPKAAFGEDLDDAEREASQESRDTDDDRDVEALLAGAASSLGADEIAYALRWDLHRARAALRSLAQRLQATGQKLHRSQHARYSLIADSDRLSAEALQLAARAEVARGGIDIGAARLLREVCDSPVAEASALGTNPRRVNTARLARLGLAELCDGTLQLTSEARFSLGLETEAPT